jgi:exosortase K
MTTMGAAGRFPQGLSRDRVANFGCIALALGLAWALKAFYSRADFESLMWVLSPTRRLVQWLTAVRFEPEPGQGYLSRDRLYLIAPACAGVNFMIIAFVSLVAGLVHTRNTLPGRLALLVGSGLAAYGATVLANGARIALALKLHAAGATFGPLTADRLHCAVGVTVYLVFLFALFAAAVRVTGANRDLAF